jgi:hypothetical protein
MVMQVVLFWLAWELYRLGRYLVRSQPRQAYFNAKAVLEVQSAWYVGIEHHAQHVALAWEPFTVFVNRYYVYGHFAPVLGCFAWLYVRHPAQFARFRTAIVSATFVGLGIHATFPLAPPRLMAELGMIDSLTVFGPRVYDADRWSGLTNQFAAMPSFHFGWSLLVATAVIVTWTSRWRWLALAHPAFMLFAVMATANHYLLDAVVGGALVMVGIRWAPVVDQLLRTAHAPARGHGRSVSLGSDPYETSLR